MCNQHSDVMISLHLYMQAPHHPPTLHTMHSNLSELGTPSR